MVSQTDKLDEIALSVVDDFEQWNKFHDRLNELQKEIDSISVEGVDSVLSSPLIKKPFVDRKYKKQYEAKRYEYNHYAEICNWIHDDYLESLKKILPLVAELHPDEIELTNSIKVQINEMELKNHRPN